MGYALRRSLPSLLGLTALLFAVGAAAVAFLDFPSWFAPAFAIAVVLIQYAVNPWIVQWLVPATIVSHDGAAYATSHPLGAILAHRCRQAGIPLVKLGIVEDGTPNAFTFGHVPGDARIWVTRGLVDRLDERELDAVIAHEVGHIKNRDFILMTVVAVIPMTLYLVYQMARRDRDGAAIAIAAYAAYVVSQLTLLAFSRAREYSADHWSCEATGDGDALCSALVKIAYGIGEVDAARKRAAEELTAQGKEGAERAKQLLAASRRTRSISVMGILEPRQAEAMVTAVGAGIEPERAIAAMRWDIVNPWARLLEKLSSHPLVARRIGSLEASTLPGAPRTWSVLRAASAAPAEEVTRARLAFAQEVLIAVAPWAVLAAVFGFGAFRESPSVMGVALVAAGILFFAKQHVRYPGEFQPVERVTDLLHRLDASPVTGIPVEVRGRIIGRGSPGYVLSPDLVVQDESGFVPLLYRQPIPLLATLFALFRVEKFLGTEVVARGWYRRMPAPVVELRDVVVPGGRRARAWLWLARYTCSVLLTLVGVAVLLASF